MWYRYLVSALIVSALYAGKVSAQWRDENRFVMGDSLHTVPYTAPNVLVEGIVGLAFYTGAYYGTGGDKYFSGRSETYSFILPCLSLTSVACWYTAELTSNQKSSYLLTLLGTALGQMSGLILATKLGKSAPGILHLLGAAIPTVTLAIVFANANLSPREERIENLDDE